MNTKATEFEARRATRRLIAETIDHLSLGGRSGLQELAGRLGLVYQNIRKWQRRGVVPAEQVLPLYVASEGRCKPWLLRPDLYPPGKVSVLPASRFAA